MNNGYTRIPHELMRNPNLPPIAKVVWSLIAGMRPDFNATMSQYCKMVACHPNTWRSVIKMLELFGMVSVEYRANGVTYTAITDTSKWTVEGNKICNPNKNCKGNKNCDAGGNKICDPSEEHITEEQKKNIAAARARAREESIILGLKIYDQWSEAICMKHHIDPTQWSETVDAFVLDMRCRNQDLTVITDIRAYFNGWINKREQNGNNQQTGNTGDPIDKLNRDAAKAMAALASQIGKPKEVPF